VLAHIEIDARGDVVIDEPDGVDGDSLRVAELG